MLRRLFAHRNLLKNMVIRDLKYRYVGSVGGLLWSVIHPLMLLVSYTFVYKYVFRQPVKPEVFGTDSFAVFFFCGFLPWLLFTDTVTRSCNSIVEQKNLITKTIIPAEILPISITLSTLVNHLIGLAILFAVLATFYTIPGSTIFILIYMAMLLMFAQGLGWIVAGLQVFVRDTVQALQVIMMLWFWFTPVFYPASTLPKSVQSWLNLNPMTTIVTGYRNSLLHLQQPTLDVLLPVFAVSALVFIFGALVFRQAKPAFADVL